MIGVDISNVWCSVSLPELLGGEKTISAAHMALAGGEYRQNAYLGWLTQSPAARGSYLSTVEDAGKKIRENSDTLVVVGGGNGVFGAQAALRLCRGRIAGSPRLIFTGSGYSTDDWLDVVAALENAEFSVLVVSADGDDAAPLITLRALRWIMEKRYGETMKDRIFVSTKAPKGALRRLAESEGYTILPMPTEPGGTSSVFSPAALTILAASGRSASDFFGGAAEQMAPWDVRSFDNPVWLYAGARTVLSSKGLTRELVCTPSPASAAFGTWWKRTLTAACCKDGAGVFCDHFRLPEDLCGAGDQLLDKGQRQYAALLRLPQSGKKAAVEMDWKDLDGLNVLAGQNLDYVEETVLTAIQDELVEQEVPFVTIECSEQMTDTRLGELFCFTELAAALSAHAAGVNPTSQRLTASLRETIARSLGRGV